MCVEGFGIVSGLIGEGLQNQMARNARILGG
jgi:hypothetical protein